MYFNIYIGQRSFHLQLSWLCNLKPVSTAEEGQMLLYSSTQSKRRQERVQEKTTDTLDIAPDTKEHKILEEQFWNVYLPVHL
jgi:hypothetical protein